MSVKPRLRGLKNGVEDFMEVYLIRYNQQSGTWLELTFADLRGGYELLQIRRTSTVKTDHGNTANAKLVTT